MAPVQLTISTGHPLVLNCTTNGNVSANQILWKYNATYDISVETECFFKQHWLSDSRTLQMTIPATSPKDSGIYDCGFLWKTPSKKRVWHVLGNKAIVHIVGGTSVTCVSGMLVAG